LFDVDFLNCQW